MRGRTVLIVSGVLLAAIVAAAPGEIDPGLVPGVAGILVGVGGLYWESLDAESWATRTLEAGVVATLFGSLHVLSGGSELFFMVATVAALFVAQSAVIAWGGPSSEDERSWANGHSLA